MEALLSLADVKKSGYKAESNSTFIKGKSRMVLCPSCNKMTETKTAPDKTGMLSVGCFWCGPEAYTIKVKLK